MSKFKVGDKVWYEGKVFEIDLVKEILEGQFLYYFNNGYDYAGHGGIYLKPYKTPHQELLDLGWIIDKDDTNPANLEFYYKNNKVLIIDKALKVIKTLYDIDLQLAKILVRYLEELE